MWCLFADLGSGSRVGDPIGQALATPHSGHGHLESWQHGKGLWASRWEAQASWEPSTGLGVSLRVPPTNIL